jgi:deubiquitinase DESI2
MSRYGGLQTVSSSRVILNVYDLNEVNDNLYNFGLGMYHSGVQIGGLEWTFAGGAGIYSDSPKSAPAQFRESIDMGEFPGGSRDVDAILDDLRQKYLPNSYHVLSQNCNCFAEDFCQRLLGMSIPGYVNRLAGWGSMVQCIIPDSMTQPPPPGGDSSSSSGGGGGSGGYYGGGNRKYAQANPVVNSFNGSSSKLGGDTLMRPMATSSSNENAESIRRARLNALSSK